MRRILIVLLCVAFGMTGYTWHRSAFALLSDIPQQRVPLFKDVTIAAGLADTTLSFSAASSDVDGDGYPDLALSLHSILHFYRNIGDGTFTPPISLGGKKGRDIHGISFIDINHDGKSDLAVTRGAKRGRGVKTNEYYVNTNSSLEALLELPSVLVDSLGRGRSITPADINRDGLADLFLINGYSPQRPNRVALAIPGMPVRYKPLEINREMETILSSGIIAVDLDNNGINEYILQQARGQYFAILTMEQLGHFKDQSKQLGIRNVNRVFAALPFDYDNDGDMDILLARGQAEPRGASLVGDRLFFRYIGYRVPRKVGFTIPVDSSRIALQIRFEGRRAFQYLYLGKNRRPASAALVEKISSDSPILRGNPHINPEMDVGGFLWRNQKNVLVYEFIGKPGELESNTGILTFSGGHGPIMRQFGIPKPQKTLTHLLYRNDGGIFKDVTPQSGFDVVGDAVDAISADFNNDGFLDIYMVSGSDFLVNHPNHLFLNNGDGTFTDVVEEAQAKGPDMGSGNGSIAFDFDLDGDLDLFIYNGATREGPLVLLQNELDRTNQAVFIDLIGTRSNTRGWGTRVTAKVGGQTLYRQKYALNGHLSTSDLPIHLGLGTTTYIDSLTVFWPAGHDTTLYRVPAGARLTITE